MRKSFVIHIDSLDILDDLSDAQAGQLFRAIKAFQKGEELSLDPMVKIAFSPLKNQFIRDNEKYEKTCKRRAEAGSKGGLAKVANASNSKQKVSIASNSKQELANLADNDNKNDNKTKNDTNYLSTEVDLVFNYWLLVMNKDSLKSKLTDKRSKAIKARIKEGYSVEVIKQAVDGCRRDAFSMGVNDRGKPFNDIELICRTGEKLESFLNVPSPSKYSKTTQKNIINLEGWENQ